MCTIHDLIPLRLPQTTLDNKKYFYGLIDALVRKCDRIVTVSEHSRRDILNFFKIPEERVVNTYQSVAVDPTVASLSEDEVARRLEQYGLEHRGYFLFVGAIEPKKNVSRIIEAHAASASKYPLVIAGRPGWQFEADLKLIKDERFRSFQLSDNVVRQVRTVRHLNYVPRAALMLLLRGARALVFPSLYEGFGLPVLEAMALGTPVITSTTSSMPEVSGDAALLVDPYDIGSISTAIRQLDDDAGLRREMGEKGLKQADKFSPENYRARLSALYTGLL